jgi:hypothetical protein
MQSTELEVEQIVAGVLEDVKLPAEVYGSPTTAAAEGDHVAGL